MASELKLEVGKFYKTRDGRKVGPMKPAGDEFHASHGDNDLDRAVWNSDGSLWIGSGSDPIAIIAEWTDAPTGPVRMVTRKDIVPGVYGKVQVFGSLSVSTELMQGPTELRAAIATLTEIADALEADQ